MGRSANSHRASKIDKPSHRLVVESGLLRQVPPAPRHGHSAVWDGAQRMLVFGGSCGSSEVHVLSLGLAPVWAEAPCLGQPPEPRSGHVALMLSPTLMLVFGGVSPQVRVCGASWGGWVGRKICKIYMQNSINASWHCNAQANFRLKLLASRGTRNLIPCFAFFDAWRLELKSSLVETNDVFGVRPGRAQFTNLTETPCSNA